jgi:hypothetical protein
VGDPDLFRVALQLGSDCQVFVDTPWQGRGPEELAAEIREKLTAPPHQWRATWHAIKPALAGPPQIAQRAWNRASF